MPGSRCSRFANASFVCGGEGPYTLVDLLEVLTSTEPENYTRVRGLYYRDGEAIRVNPPAPLVKDLDGEMPATLLDEAINLGEAETRAPPAAFGGEERIEGLGEHLRRHAGAGVGHPQPGVPAGGQVGAAGRVGLVGELGRHPPVAAQQAGHRLLLAGDLPASRR